MFRRRRFADLIERQLDLFEEDHADEIAETVTRLKTYNAAAREDAEEAYGDYADSVDWVRESLEELRDTYQRTLDGEAGDAYEAEFDRAVAKRWPKFAL
jgi:uncharacterized protein YukE